MQIDEFTEKRIKNRLEYYMNKTYISSDNDLLTFLQGAHYGILDMLSIMDIKINGWNNFKEEK